MTGSALEIAERALALASEDEAEAVVQSERSGLARFAASSIHQPTLVENVTVRLRVVRGGRAGSAATNRLSDDGLAALAGRAADACAHAPADPDFPGLAPVAELPTVDGLDDETASLGAGDLAGLARAAIDAAGSTGVHGFVTAGVTGLAVATTTGVRAEHVVTDATAVVLAAEDGASGFASASSWRAGALDPADVARRAVETARRTRGASALEPGTYRAVLAPDALAELLDYFSWDAFSGLGLLEERSFLTGRIGERVFDEKVTIADDPLEPEGQPKRFDFEGTPKARVVLVEDGVARGVVWDRRTAARAGQESSGHAPPPELAPYGPLAFSLSVAPGEVASTDELAALVGDGVYVTRIHYPSVVNPREGIITGMTRDGTFRIRSGRIAEPLVNLRFTVSVPRLLGDVAGLTRERCFVNRSEFYGDRYPFGVLCPAVATACFTVTGIGSGPGL